MVGMVFTKQKEDSSLKLILKIINYNDLDDKVVTFSLRKKYKQTEYLAHKTASYIINKFMILDCKVIIRKSNASIN